MRSAFQKIRQIFILAFFGALLWSCDSSKNTSEKPSQTAGTGDSFAYEIKKFHRSAEDCNAANCTELTVNIPEFTTEDSQAEKINSIIKSQVNQSVAEFVMGAKDGESTETLANKFLTSYKEFKATFPESKAPWYINADAMVSYSSGDFISIAISNSSYTGGAHPNTSIKYLNISTQGKIITELDYFFKDVPKLKAQLESNFRSDQGITKDESYADKGFLFENDQFTLSDNFGFNQQGLIMYYNPYEIAAYSEGAIVVTIPFSLLSGNFKF